MAAAKMVEASCGHVYVRGKVVLCLFESFDGLQGTLAMICPMLLIEVAGVEKRVALGA